MQGHIHRRVHSTADGRTTTTWYVVVDVGRDAKGKRRQKWHGGFKTRREAEAVRAKLVTDLHAGTYVLPTKTTLAEWVHDAWLIFAKSRVKATTFLSYERTLELHLLPRLGSTPLGDITTATLNHLYADLLAGRDGSPGGKGLSPRSVIRLHAIVRKVLADAIDAGLIAANPAANAKPPRVDRAATSLAFWTASELALFLDQVKGHELEIAFHLLAYTGMRRGEALGLRWEDVDLERGALAIRHTLVCVGYTVRDETPKSRKTRVVNLDAGTVERLRELRVRVELQPGGVDDRSTVVTTVDGARVHPDRLTKVFDALVRKAGLRRIPLHGLRHTHATLALRAGVPVKVISERLGHESPAFTLSQYAHVMPGMQAEAAEQIAALIRVDRPA